MRFDEVTRSLLLVVALTAKLQNISGARILLMSPQLQSHVMRQTATGEELVRRGHEVYVAIAATHRNPEALEQLGLRTVTYRVPPSEVRNLPHWSEYLQSLAFSPDYDAYTFAQSISAKVSMQCEFMMSDDKFMDRVRVLKLDIAVVEPFHVNPCVLLLPYSLNVRFVSMSNYYLPWSIRMPALPSFLQSRDPINVPIGSESVLWDTVIYLRSLWRATFRLWNSTLLQHHSSKGLTWTELILKSELFLIISDHHLGSPLPTFPNTIPVPCVTVRPTKPLPDELEKLAIQSRDGIILATFGSMTSSFPDPVVVKFLEAFSRVRQTVFAKMHIPEGVSVPRNVHVYQWLPQNDILAHQRTKLFITHCGNNGQHEALYHAVPMLGFPLFGDQPTNCERARAKGFGLKMNIHDFTSDELFDNIREILDNATYGDNIRRRSAILRDQPLVGPNKSAHWIEHVIKHGSAHLRSPAMDLPLHRFLMLDVIAVVFVMTFVAITIACLSTVVITRTICTKWMYQPNDKKAQ